MAERDIRKALKKRAEEYGGEVRAMSWLGRRNAPDVLCLFPEGTRLEFERENAHPFIETKAPNGKPTAAQTREHERMRDAGCTVLVISTLAQLDAWLSPRA
jgi:hypothetical protein